MVETDVELDERPAAEDPSINHQLDDIEQRQQKQESKELIEKERDNDRVKKWIVTFLFCMLNIGGGTLIVVMGSVLLDMQILTRTTSSQIAWIFPSKSLGLLVGILTITIFLKDRLPYVVFVMSWVFALSVAVTSFCTNLYVLVTVTFLQGLSVVCIWVGGTLSMAAMWRQEKATALYILSFGLYFGFLIGPGLSFNFTVRHYEKYFDENGLMDDRLNDTMLNMLNGINGTSDNNATNVFHPNRDKIQMRLFTLFLIIAADVAIFGTLTFIACLKLGLEKLQIPKADEVNTSEHTAKGKPWIGWFLLAIASVVQFIGDGQVNSTVGSYLKSYVVLYMNLSKSQATIVAFAFNGTYVGWTCMGAYIQKRLGPTWSFYIMAQCNIIGTAIMFISGKEFVPFCVGIGLLGIGLSAKSSALICWVTDKVGMVTHVTFATYIAWALGDMFQATMVGDLFDANPHTFVYILFAGSCLFFLSFFVGQFGYCLMTRGADDPSWWCFKKNEYKEME